MCGRYVYFTSEEYREMKEILEKISERYKTGISIMKSGEIFPTDTVPAITAGPGTYDARLLKWGIPFYNRPGKVIINARSETITQKPLFKNLVEKGRCLIPAHGFYEWKKEKDRKQKYLIKPKGEKLFYMAGLYKQDSFVIITADASLQMNDIHDRMPVILTKDKADSWLYDINIPVNKILGPYDKELDIKTAV